MTTAFAINGIVLLVACPTYLSTISYLIIYLRRRYSMVWTELGEPDFAKIRDDKAGQIVAMLRLFRFIFGNRSVAMKDQGLTRLIWVVRISAVALLVGFANLFILGDR